MKPRIKSMILEHKEAKNNQSEQQEEKNLKKKKNEDSVSSHWDNFKSSNMCIIEVPEGKEKEEEIGKLFEKTMKQNSPNLVKNIDLQI